MTLAPNPVVPRYVASIANQFQMGCAVPNKCVLIYDTESRKEPEVLRYIRPQTSLSWNQTDPSMLATISSDKLLFWDVRQTKKEVINLLTQPLL